MNLTPNCKNFKNYFRHLKRNIIMKILTKKINLFHLINRISQQKRKILLKIFKIRKNNKIKQI